MSVLQYCQECLEHYGYVITGSTFSLKLGEVVAFTSTGGTKDGSVGVCIGSASEEEWREQHERFGRPIVCPMPFYHKLVAE
jgi:hypothetical protein